jgi:hypothetical protein
MSARASSYFSLHANKYCTPTLTGYIDEIDNNLKTMVEQELMQLHGAMINTIQYAEPVMRLLKVCPNEEMKSHVLPFPNDLTITKSSTLQNRTVYHIPVFTNPYAVVDVYGRSYHYSTDNIYMIDKRANGLSIKNGGNTVCLHIVIELTQHYVNMDRFRLCDPLKDVSRWGVDTSYLVSSFHGLYLVDTQSGRIDLVRNVRTFGLTKCTCRYFVFFLSKPFKYGGIASFVINKDSFEIEDWVVESTDLGFDNDTHQIVCDKKTNRLYVLETGYQRVKIVQLSSDEHFDKNVEIKMVQLFEPNENNTRMYSNEHQSPFYRHCNSISSDGERIYILSSYLKNPDKNASIGIFDMELNLIYELVLESTKDRFVHEVTLPEGEGEGGKCVSYVSSDHRIYTVNLTNGCLVSEVAFDPNEVRWQRGLVISPSEDKMIVGCGTSIQVIENKKVKSVLITPCYPCVLMQV